MGTPVMYEVGGRCADGNDQGSAATGIAECYRSRCVVFALEGAGVSGPGSTASSRTVSGRFAAVTGTAVFAGRSPRRSRRGPVFRQEFRENKGLDQFSDSVNR